MKNGHNGSGTNVGILTFPCAIDIKAIGRQSNRFVALVESLVRKHVEEDHFRGLQSRPSSRGNYLSVTCRIHAQSRAQMDAIYQDLTDCDEVVMAL